MIKSLELINHECHKHTVVDFAPGLNVFIGPTDAGKSSVFRAMYWLINNRPLGNSMLPLFWKGDTEVVATFTNPDSIIKRMKGKSLNHYQLNDNDPINAGQKGPPEEIAKAILMDDVNFQTQVDRAFLMFETPGERGRILNKVAGLDDIDKMIKIAKSDESRLKQEYEKEKSLIISYESDLEQFADIEKREQLLIICEQLEKHLQLSWNRKRKLLALVDSVSNLDIEIAKHEKFLECEDGLKQAKQLATELFESRQRSARIRKVIAKVARFDALLERSKQIPKIEKEIKELKGQQKEIDNHKIKADRLKTIIRQLKMNEVESISISKEIKEYEAEIKTLKANLPGVCEACGQEIPNDN